MSKLRVFNLLCVITNAFCLEKVFNSKRDKIYIQRRYTDFVLPTPFQKNFKVRIPMSTNKNAEKLEITVQSFRMLLYMIY